MTLVVALPPDFSVSATPLPGTVAPAAGTSLYRERDTLQRIHRHRQLQRDGLPSGATASFSPASVAGSGSTTLSVNTLSSTPYGHFYSDGYSDQRHADSHSTSDPGLWHHRQISPFQLHPLPGR